VNALLHWFAAPEWSQVVKTLLHSLWQGVLIAAMLALVMRRVANPHLRYRLALLTLVMIPASGILTWAAMNSPNRSLPVPAVQPAPVETALVAAPSENPQTKLVMLANRSPAPPPTSWTAWLALLWIVGTSAMLGRASVKLAGAERLRRSCQPLDNPQVTQLLAEARRAVGLARRVRVAVTDRLTSPAVVGVLVPTLVLPLSLVTTLTPEQIRFILLHELAHIRRGDYFANLFQFFIEAVLFFNPAVWWISHQVRREREACCDALAIELSGAPADYARTLVHIAESALTPSPVAAPAFGNEREPSSLTDRVQRLLVPGYRPSLRLTWRAMVIAFALGTVLLVVSAEGTRVAVAQIAKSNQETPASSTLPPLNQAVTNDSTFAFSDRFTNQFALGEAPLGPNAAVPFRVFVIESPEFERVKRKLSDFRFDLVVCSNKPLGELFRELSERSEALDQEGVGLRYSIVPIRLRAIPANLDPPLTNANLFEILAALQGGPRLQLNGVTTNGLITLSPSAPLAARSNPPGKSERATDARQLQEVEAHSTASNSTPAVAESTNRYAINDVVAVRFSGTIDYIPPHEERIRKDGTITIPLIGAVTAAGKTAIELQEEIHDAYVPAYYKRLTVTVSGEATVSFVGGRVPVRQLGKTSPAKASQSSGDFADLDDNRPPAQSRSTPVSSSTFPTTNASELFARTFKVDQNTFGKALESITATPVTGTNITGAVRSFFATLGVELTSPKGVYYNDRAGELVVRGTIEDLNVIEAALVAANKPAPQVNIKVRFVELEGGNYGFDWYLGTIGNQSNTNTRPPVGNTSTSTTSNAGPQSFTGILTDPQFRVVLRALEQRKGFSLLSEGEVTTLSGRQAQIQVVELKTIVNGFEPVRGSMESLRKQAKEQDAAVEKAKVELTELRSKLQISDFDAGLTAPQPQVEMEEYKRYLATRFEREVVYKGRLEQFRKLSALSPKELRDVLPGIEPDPTLSELINELNTADQKIKSLSQDVSETHPEYVRVKEQRKLLNEKIDARVAGILKRLETQVAVLKSELDSLVESVETARKLDQEKLTQSRPYYDKKRELEDMLNSRRLLTREINLEEIRHLPSSVPTCSLTGNTETNLANKNLFRAQTLPFGPVLDVIPTVAADGYTIQMTVIPTVTEFLGYDDPKKVLASSPVKSKDAETLPLPRMRVRQASTSAVVWDGQTLVLGIGNDQVITKQPGGGVQKTKNPDTHQKQLLVFITPTIIDQGGNRANPDAASLPARSQPPHK
jgi:beta-lactamase regulating signal transducer with metallopeptidase domain/Flp pilus assembly secretin CpaC